MRRQGRLAVFRAVREREELHEVEGGVGSRALLMALMSTFRGGIGRSAARLSLADPRTPVTIRLGGVEDDGSTALDPDLPSVKGHWRLVQQHRCPRGIDFGLHGLEGTPFSYAIKSGSAATNCAFHAARS